MGKSKIKYMNVNTQAGIQHQIFTKNSVIRKVVSTIYESYLHMKFCASCPKAVNTPSANYIHMQP